MSLSLSEAPVVLTAPHFLDTAVEYSSLIQGLSPKTELHETYVLMEPVKISYSTVLEIY